MSQDSAGHRASPEVSGTRNELAQVRTNLADDRTIVASALIVATDRFA